MLVWEVEVFALKVRTVAMLSVLILASFATGAFAASNIEEVKAYLRKDYQVFVNGVKTDVGPVLVYNNKSYLQLTAIGKVMGADVVWNQSNQGIYVNPIIYEKPDPTQADNAQYTAITMVQPQGYKAEYRGAETPVLSVTTSDYGTTYYRVSDLKRLNVDMSGLHLARETRTGELYVSNKELARLGQDQPKFSYYYEKIVTGNPDPEQLKVVQNYIDGLPEMYKAMNMKDPNFPEMDYYTVPYIYAIDALPNDEFNILGLENYEFKRYWLKLKKNMLDNWYRAEEKITPLGSNLPQY